jgi:DNA-binding SARP family transcriptional activator/Tfp pilus assembly protein PilF
MPTGLEIRVLGPLEIVHNGCTINIGGPQLRRILARLLIDAGRTVSLAALVNELWGDRVPPDAERTARTYVSRLRAVLAGPGHPGGTEHPLTTSPPGYELRVAPATVDAGRFEALAAAGRRALGEGDARLASARLTEGLELWRGNAYAEFQGGSAVAVEGARLDELRLVAVEDRIAAALALGQSGPLVGELEALVAAHPARERLWGEFMIALYRSGRQAEALAAYRSAREVLIDEYGVEPSPALAGIHRQILQQDAGLDGTAAPERDTGVPAPGRDAGAPGAGPETRVAAAGRHPVPAPAWPAPAQLPVGLRTLVGRRPELSWLDTSFSYGGPSAADGPAAVLAIICGMAGVGKTTLAVHWGHRMADRFPDGQLYVDLRGFSPCGPVLEPAEVLGDFLAAFGVPATRVPSGQDQRAALYRSLLAGKRVLVVLDNARDAEQIRPLLPGAPGSMALITSRVSLAGLVAAEGAQRLRLDVLTTEEAHELLTERLGPARAEGEAAAIEEIIARCARLPLALAIAATHPDGVLSAVADELDSLGALDALETGDATVNVRAVFSWSYQALSPLAARLFRLLGVHPAPDITAPVAASLLGADPRRARAALRELEQASLLGQHRPGRYVCHDLLRVYALGLSTTLDPEPDRDAASRREIDHYVYTAQDADLLVYPQRVPMDLGQPMAGVTPQPLAGAAAGWEWLEAEASNLLAVQLYAVERGWYPPAWRLAWVTRTFHQRKGRLHELRQAWRVGLTAAERLGEHDKTILAHVYRAEAAARFEDFAEAHGHLGEALALADRSGDRARQVDVHWALARTWSRQEQHELALEHAGRALELVESLEPTYLRLPLLNAAGWYAARAGRIEQATEYLRTALDLARREGHRLTEAHALDSMGYLALRSGEPGQARDLLARALNLARDNGDAVCEATVLERLGDANAALDDTVAARSNWDWAGRLYLEQHRNSEADCVRQKLELLDRPAALRGTVRC